MAKIVPAILAHSQAELSNQLNQTRRLTDRVQIDIIDGKYAENTTIAPEDLVKTTELKYDIHLMVNDPVEYAQRCLGVVPNLVIIQYETQGNVIKAIEQIKKAGFSAGIAINPKTTINSVAELIKELDHLLIMGYEAGFSGQKFQPDVLKKPAQARKIKPDIEVGLDGGITGSNIKKINEAKFDIINVNTFLFNNPNKSSLEAYSELLEGMK